MPKRAQHVVKSPSGGWAVKMGGASRATKIFKTQEAAIEYGRKIARKQRSELYVHSSDGKIRDKDSYGRALASQDRKR